MSSLADHLFQTLADPTRRRIFEHLCQEGEQSVSALTERAGISQPAVSRHLSLLKKAGLVRDRQDGRHARYSPNCEALAPLADWTGQMSAFWGARFNQLESLLRRMDQ